MENLSENLARISNIHRALTGGYSQIFLGFLLSLEGCVLNTGEKVPHCIQRVYISGVGAGVL